MSNEKAAEKFFAKTRYEVHDWATDPLGTRTLEGRYPGQQDLQERLNNLHGRAAAITRRSLRGEQLEGHRLFDTAGNLIADTYAGFRAVWDKLAGTKAGGGIGQPLWRLVRQIVVTAIAEYIAQDRNRVLVIGPMKKSHT